MTKEYSEPPTQGSDQTQKLPERALVTPDSALDLRRLMHSLPPDVHKKMSLHDLARICQNYNTIPCPNCYGGHQRPCQWCGDSGSVEFQPNEVLPLPSVGPGNASQPVAHGKQNPSASPVSSVERDAQKDLGDKRSNP